MSPNDNVDDEIEEGLGAFPFPVEAESVRVAFALSYLLILTMP